ncbi:MAG: hypothetical protein AUI10_02435 [Actinobacteria bacterium 13_2_20CM_2_72_6]|nr:MAG: hypothetical protein AUI10_02435 [Actinobacteria bacterium 13_2_20CM_2_72_6]
MPVRRWYARGLAVAALLAAGVPGGPAYAVPDASADVALSASASGPAVPGQPLTWTVTATNHGPSAAEAVTVTQTVPLGSGEKITSAASGVGPCNVRPPGTVTCDLGRLDDGATVRIVVGQALAADRTEAATTSAIATAGTPDAGTADNTATASAAPQRIADLWLSGGVTGPDSVLGGPPAVSLLLTNDVGVGSKSAVPLVIKGTPAPPTALRYPVTADPPAGTADPEPANNKATLANPGAGQADLAIVTSGPTDPVDAGTTVSFTYTVTDRGPADATGVTVTATLPQGIGLDSSSTGCTASGATLTCPTIASLAAGTSAAMVVTLTVDAAQPAGTVLHAVRAAAAAPGDLNGPNAVAYAPIAVVRRANLGLSASRADGPLTAGAPVSYDVTVHNFGPATATGVVVTDRLPDPVALGTATVRAGGSCTVAGALHTCTLTDPLAVDTSVVVRITGTVDADTAGATLTDAAFASALEAEPDTTDNGASSTGVVEGDMRSTQARQARSGSAIRRLVAAGGRLAWWTWAGGGTVLLGLILLAIALRRAARRRLD